MKGYSMNRACGPIVLSKVTSPLGVPAWTGSVFWMTSVNLPVLASRQFTRKKAFPVTVNGLLVKEPICVRLIRVPVAGDAGVNTRGGRVAIGGTGLVLGDIVGIGLGLGGIIRIALGLGGIGGIGLGLGGIGVLVAGAVQAARRKTSTSAIFVFVCMDFISSYYKNRISV